MAIPARVSMPPHSTRRFVTTILKEPLKGVAFVQCVSQTDLATLGIGSRYGLPFAKRQARPFQSVHLFTKARLDTETEFLAGSLAFAKL